jgi:hypothetical protein
MNKFLTVKTRVKSLSKRRICLTERVEMTSLRGKVSTDIRLVYSFRRKMIGFSVE